MYKRIFSIILIITLVFCQSNLFLNTASAKDTSYIVAPVGYDVTVDAADWAASSVTIYNNDDGELVFYDEGHENPNKERYESGWMELKNLSIDVRNYCAIEITTFVENAKPLTRYDGTDWTSGNNIRPQMYYTGEKSDGSTIRLNEANSTSTKFGQYIVSGDKNNGYYSENYETCVWETSGAWTEMSKLTMLRFDVLKNSSGTVRVKSIRFIEKPGISSIGFNSAYEADIDAMPVDPDTIDIGFTGPLYSIDGSVTVTDPNNNEVALSKTSIINGKAVLELEAGTELTEFKEYTVTFDENTMVTQNKKLRDPIVFTFTTDDSKAPSIFDTIDPDRPSDYTDDNVIWSAEFKIDADIDYFPSSNGIKTEIAYGEYLKYTAPAPYINGNGNLVGSYVDTSFSPAIDANLVNRLQIRMKVVNAVTEGTITGKNSSGVELTKNRVAPHLQLYFAGVNDDGSKFYMNGAHSYSDDSKYKMMTDDNGNKCTDWFIYDINLNNISSWVAAKEITTFRFDVMNNCEGVALIDYIRFLGPKMPEIEMIKYNSEFDIDEVQGLPINSETVDIYLTDPIYSVDKNCIIFEDSDGNEANVKNVSLSTDGKVVTVVLAEELNSNATYYIGFNDKAMLTATANFTEYVIYETSTTAYRAPSIVDIIDPDRPDDTIPNDMDAYSIDFKDSRDLEYFPSAKNLNTEIKYGEYMQHTTTQTTLGPNGNATNYYVDSDFRSNPINSDRYTRLQIRMKVVEQTHKGNYDGYFKMYFKGDNGVSMSSSNAISVVYNYRTDEQGRYGTDWMIIDIDLSDSSAWSRTSYIETIRFNFLENAAGTVLIDYIRFVYQEPKPTVKCNKIKYGDYTIIEVNTENIEENYNIFLATYKDQKLIHTEIIPYAQDTEYFSLDYEFDKYKVFVWNPNMLPLTKFAN